MLKSFWYEKVSFDKKPRSKACTYENCVDNAPKDSEEGAADNEWMGDIRAEVDGFRGTV